MDDLEKRVNKALDKTVDAVWEEYEDSKRNKWTFRKDHIESAILRILIPEMEARIAEAVKAEREACAAMVESEMVKVSNDYAAKGNMAGATAIHDAWFCVYAALDDLPGANQ